MDFQKIHSFLLLPVPQYPWQKLIGIVKVVIKSCRSASASNMGVRKSVEGIILKEACIFFAGRLIEFKHPSHPFLSVTIGAVPDPHVSA